MTVKYVCDKLWLLCTQYYFLQRVSLLPKSQIMDKELPRWIFSHSVRAPEFLADIVTGFDIVAEEEEDTLKDDTL